MLFGVTYKGGKTMNKTKGMVITKVRLVVTSGVNKNMHWGSNAPWASRYDVL